VKYDVEYFTVKDGMPSRFVSVMTANSIADVLHDLGTESFALSSADSVHLTVHRQNRSQDVIRSQDVVIEHLQADREDLRQRLRELSEQVAETQRRLAEANAKFGPR
jgi:peptidoglycan hydrolase CwlO-like protein